MFPFYPSSSEKGVRDFGADTKPVPSAPAALPGTPRAGACWNRQAGGSVARARRSLATLSRQTVLRGAWCLLKQLPGCLNMQLRLVWKSGSGWEPASGVLPPSLLRSLTEILSIISYVGITCMWKGILGWRWPRRLRSRWGSCEVPSW